MIRKPARPFWTRFLLAALSLGLLVFGIKMLPPALAQPQKLETQALAQPQTIETRQLAQPTGTACTNYTVTPGTDTIVPGTDDIGNHGDDGTTFISLPFPYQLYGQSFTGANVSSNGNLQFLNSSTAFTNSCLPSALLDFPIMPYWDDLSTDLLGTGCTAYGGVGCGVFTSTSGAAPNRIFNIEWRTVYFNDNSTRANFEVRLFEGQNHFDVVYGEVAEGGSSATVGVQQDTGSQFTQFECNTAGTLTNGLQLVFTEPPCGPTPTPTPTPTAPPSCQYTITPGTAPIVPGATDIGSNCDDCDTLVTLPFSFQLYDQTYTTVNVSSNGRLDFVTPNEPGFLTACLPAPPNPNGGFFDFTIFPLWLDQQTNTGLPACASFPGGTCGIFTSISGNAPDRVFNIEWRTVRFANNTQTENYEVRLFENASASNKRFDIIYGTLNGVTDMDTGGVQGDSFAGFFTQDFCNTPAPANVSRTYTVGACPTPACTPGWPPGGDLPTVGTRMAGVYFPTNGRFYAMGGRSSDAAGSDFTHPFEYDPDSNTWTTKEATYPDNQVNNMACAVLTNAGSSHIYCVGGSAATQTTATTRVFFYDPIADTLTTLPAGDGWPGDMAGTILPGGFSVLNNKLYILGGFNINVASTNQIWEFDPTAAVGSKWTQKVNTPVGIMFAPTCTIGGIIYVAGASDFQGGVVVDSTNSFSFNPVTNTLGAIAAIPRATGETRAVNFNGQMWVLGGGRVAPNPSNKVDIYDPTTNSWTTGIPFTTARRNFPADTDGTGRIWLAGGYDTTGVPVMSTEFFCGAISKALNISTRLRVQTGNNVLIGGFIITGTVPKTVAVRGIGPSLGPAGIPDFLPDPTLELHDSSGALLMQNNNWQDDPSQAAQLMALGLAPTDPLESGLVTTLPSNAAYTAILAGNNGGTGIGLVEVYDAASGTSSQLANISTRGFVLTGNDVMIGGFILNGTSQVALRGIGPSIPGLSPLLADPTLELHDGNGMLLVMNDNWQDDPTSAAELTAAGLAPQNPLESGIVASLPAGAYTAILAGNNGGTGIGLVEVYNLH